MVKKVVIFWVDKFWSSDFLGIKYEPLSDPPPPVIKTCEWGPWGIKPYNEHWGGHFYLDLHGVFSEEGN